MRLGRRFSITCSIFLVVLAVSLKLFLDSIYHLPILMYHSVDYTSDKNNKMKVSPDVFAKQMRYLHDKRYNVIPLEEAVSYIKEKKKPPPKTITVTLDDGYENNYKYVYPVLKKYNIPATIFIIVNVVGEEGFMNWNELKELSDSGIIDIENHTSSHRMLPYLDDDTLRDELMTSKRTLENRLKKDIKFICYPMGRYDERVKLAAKDAGYVAGFATKPTRLSPNYDLYEIKRVRISPTANNLFVFGIKISGYHAFFRVIQNDYKDIPNILWRRKSS